MIKKFWEGYVVNDNNNRKRIILMSIPSKNAKLIFDEVRKFEFRRCSLRKEDLNKKIYVCSIGEDKAIMGYIKVSEVLKGNINQILELTGYKNKKDVISCCGINSQNCCALKLYDVTEFREYLELSDLRNVNPKIKLPQYYSYIYDEDPVYQLIEDWDRKYSLDGQIRQDVYKIRILSKLK